MPESDVKTPEQKLYESLKELIDNPIYFNENGTFRTSSGPNDIKAIKAAQILSETHETDQLYKDRLNLAIEAIKNDGALNADDILNETDFYKLIDDNPLVETQWVKYSNNTNPLAQELGDLEKEMDEALKEKELTDLQKQKIKEELEEELEKNELKNEEEDLNNTDEYIDPILKNLEELGKIHGGGTGGNGDKKVYTEAQKDAAAKKIKKFMMQKSTTVYQATKDLRSAMDNSDVKEAISKKKQEIIDTLTEKQYESLYNTKTNAKKIINELDQTIKKIKEIDVTSKLKNPVSSIDLPKPSDSKYTKALKKKTPSQWMREQKEGKDPSGGQAR